MRRWHGKSCNIVDAFAKWRVSAACLPLIETSLDEHVAHTLQRYGDYWFDGRRPMPFSGAGGVTTAIFSRMRAVDVAGVTGSGKAVDVISRIGSTRQTVVE